VSTEAAACPHCGVPRPAIAGWKGTGVDWKSGATYLGYPLIHVAWGRDPHGKRRVAKGVIAIGQFAIGAFTIAQFGVGLVFGLGQFMAGSVVLAQFAAGILLGAGQIATGYIAIGQLAIGVYVLAQVGIGKYIWMTGRADPEAVEMFRFLIDWFDGIFPGLIDHPPAEAEEP
jgi:hypothetical protein